MTQKDIQLSEDAARKLGGAIVRHRVERGYRSARKLGLESNLDYRTITSLESARRASVSRSTLAVLELCLDLPSGYFLSLVDGDDMPADTVELDIPAGVSASAVLQARVVAQAAFEAALQQLKAAGLQKA
jgi:hypothetical protein